jgi:quercetin dioxygenase-like cupin family protein
MRFPRAALGVLLLACLSAGGSESTAQAPAASISNLDGTKWEASPVLPDCFQMAVVHGDPATGPSVLLFKGTAGCSVSWHWHTPSERIVMVTGVINIQMMRHEEVHVVRRGGFAFLPSRHPHRATCPTACVAYATVDAPFDLHYVDESGEEISAEEGVRRAKTTRVVARR